MLSGLMLEADSSLDSEHSRCERDGRAGEVQLKIAKLDLEQAHSAFFEADGTIQGGLHEQEALRNHEATLVAEKREHAKRCERMLDSLVEEEPILEEDLRMTSEAMTMAPCASGASAALIQCTHSNLRAPVYRIEHPTWHGVMAQLNTTVARQSLQRALGRLAHRVHRWTPGFQDAPGDNFMTRYWELRRREADRRSGGLIKQRLLRLMRSSGKQGSSTSGRRHKKKGRQRHLTGARCVRALTQPDCGSVTGAMMEMCSDISEKLNEVKDEDGKVGDKCKAVSQDFDVQLKEIAIWKSKIDETIAEATARKNNARETMSMKQTEVKQVAHALHMQGKQCSDDIAALKDKRCGLEKMRKELYMVDGQTVPAVQDCEVSEWVPGACSATCAGGTQDWTRKVITPASSLGMPCPNLTKTETCNEQPCPVDCRVSAWSGWSACSAECGGGIRSRARTVQVLSRFDGEPCPDETGDTEQCNVHPCDANCVLGEWSDWSGCSRACGGGLRLRMKGVKAPPQGLGKCPTEERRMAYEQCNLAACAPAPTCASVLDVVIAMDGSHSLGAAGFEHLKAFVGALVGALQVSATQAQVAVVSMGGPGTWAAYQRCERGADAAAECSVTLASPLSADPAAVQSAVSGMQFPGRSPYASAALAITGAVLRDGRREAQPVVLMVAAGRPLSEARTAAAAAAVRKGARLMWIVLGDDLPAETVGMWASHPVRDNVIRFKDADVLADPAKLAEVVSVMCPHLAAR